MKNQNEQKHETKIITAKWLLLIILVVGCLAVCFIRLNRCQAQQTISPSFTEMKSKFVDEEKFSITFPSIPRKTTITPSIDGEKLTITSYQSDDGIGLYTFSFGELDKPLPDESSKKFFVENLFKSLVSAAANPQVYTQEQSNKMPYDLSYLYKSKFRGTDWLHMGMIFLVNDSTYIKITLIYPVEKMEIADKKYSKFLNSLRIK